MGDGVNDAKGFKEGENYILPIRYRETPKA